jgi:hypothetical protein
VLIRPAIIMVPVRLGVPLMVSTVPPLMVAIPAMLTRRSKIVPTVSRLRALRTVPGDRIIEPGFGLFNALAAFVSFVGVSEGCNNKKQKRAHRYEGSQSLNRSSTVVPTLICFQEFLLCGLAGSENADGS